MHRSTKRRLACGVSGAAALLVAASGISAASVSPRDHAEASTGLQTIQFWTSGPTQGIDHLVSVFNRQYKGKYKVDVSFIPYANETTLVNAAVSSHKQPNLLEMSLTFMTPYALDGLLEPIDPMLSAVKIDPSTDFPSGLWKSSVVNGTHYIAPNNAIPTVLFYNKKLFRAAGLNPNDPPTTGKQLIADAEKTTDASKGVYGYIEEPTGDGMNYSIQSVMFQYGVQLANSKTDKVTFDKSGSVTAVNFFRNLIWKYHVSPENASPNEAYDAFEQGKDAMLMQESSSYPAFAQAIGAANVGVALIPQVGPIHANFLGQNFWGAFKEAMTPGKLAATEKFMAFYYQHSLFLAQAGQLPTWQPTFDKSEFDAIPTYKVQAEATIEGLPHPAIPGYADYMHEYFFSPIEEALLNKESPEEAVAQAASGVQSGIDSGGSSA